MSMAHTTEPQSSSSDLGQRLFLLGVFAILMAEVVITIANVGNWFEWSSFALGVVSAVAILYLGNWLYTGSRTALMVTRLWVALEIAIVLVGLVITQSESPTDSPLPRLLGVNYLWQGYLKLAVYLGLGGLLVVPGPTLDFFRAQRGEALVPMIGANESTSASGPPAELGAVQMNALAGLESTMRPACAVLIAVGIVDTLTGLASIQDFQGWLAVIEGASIGALGLALVEPIRVLRILVGASPRNTGHVTRLFSAFSLTLTAYMWELQVLAAIAVLRVVGSAM